MLVGAALPWTVLVEDGPASPNTAYSGFDYGSLGFGFAAAGLVLLGLAGWLHPRRPHLAALAVCLLGVVTTAPATVEVTMILGTAGFQPNNFGPVVARFGPGIWVDLAAGTLACLAGTVDLVNGTGAPGTTHEANTRDSALV